MVTNYVRQRWELLGLHTVNSTGSKSGNNPLGEVRTAARERAIGFLDFLEALYALRYPPVRDIGSYRDILVRRADLSDVVGMEYRMMLSLVSTITSVRDDTIIIDGTQQLRQECSSLLVPRTETSIFIFIP